MIKHEPGRIPRAAMPQIKSNLMGDFLAEVSRQVEVKGTSIMAADLRPSQVELHEDNIAALMQLPAQLVKPLLVSADQFVLDGHHRWAANQRLGRRQPCWQLNCDAVTALQLMAGFASRHPELCGSKA